MAFHLGEYYFYQEDLRNAIIYYEQTDIGQLSNKEIALMKFHQGYGYFSLSQFDKAKPLLNTVRQMPEDPHAADANYYYGFIAYSERKYADALDAFRKVENHPEYGQAVPFYIASILYQQGQKDKALQYAESKLGSSKALYDREFQQLAGHAYFEKRQFAKALPYLEASIKGQEKITREQQYELSFCYYEGKQYAKAAEGFRLLSDGADSLTQSAMYLLGDAYLKMGDKQNARTAFAYCAQNSSIPSQREVSVFHYGKLSYELGYQDIALNELRNFVRDYPASNYNREARELLVSLMANTNNYREALDLLEGLQQPSEAAKQLYPRVAFGRAMELVTDEKPDEASRLLDKVLADPNNAAVLSPAQFWKGEIAYRQNKLDEAIRYFNSYLGGSPVTTGETSPQHARYNMGYAYLRKENYKVAQGFFEQVATAVRLNSPAVEQDAWLRNADCHYMMRDFSRANTMYAKALEYSWPSADYAQYQQAMIAGIARPSEKIRILQSFERKFPGSELLPAVNMEIANTYLADEKYKEAIPFLQQVVKIPENTGNLKPRAYLRMGIAQYNLNNNRAALDNYRTLVNQYPDAPETEEALESARAIFVEEGRTAEYADFLRAAGKTVTRSQEDSLAWSVAESRYAGGDMNATLVSLDDYLKKFPDGEFHNDALFIRSEIYNTRKDWKKAMDGYTVLADKGQGKYLEKASHQAARIAYFELKDYIAAEKYFTLSKTVTGNREQRLDAMRGLLRSQYNQKKWKEAESNAEELLKEKSISTDDKVLGSMVRGHAAQNASKFADAIQHYRSVVTLNNAAFAAEARYEIAACYFAQNDLKNTERAAFETINKSGSYDFWITRAYILLADVFWKQKDYFNAKATLQSVVENSRITELKEEAQVKLELVTEEEKKQTPIIDK
jgi:tetratricopeptide (TPR) repeat protein